MKLDALLYCFFLLLIVFLVELVILLLPERFRDSLLVFAFHGACLGCLIAAIVIVLKFMLASTGGAA